MAESERELAQEFGTEADGTIDAKRLEEITKVFSGLSPKEKETFAAKAMADLKESQKKRLSMAKQWYAVYIHERNFLKELQQQVRDRKLTFEQAIETYKKSAVEWTDKALQGLLEVKEKVPEPAAPATDAKKK